MNDLLLRSLMFVPGHNERIIAHAAKSKADALILDIEDSVKPDCNKAVARDTCERWIRSGNLNKYSIFPRINDRESGHMLRDTYQLTISGVKGFMYPKAKRGGDIYFFDKLLETIEYEKGLPVGGFSIIPLIETASAVINAQEICQASKRVIAVAFGCEDFIADLQGIHDRDSTSIFTARAMIAMAARASGVVPIDTVHIEVNDLEDLEKNLIIAKKLGFEGMLILHPKELDLAHRYFSPTDNEIQEALEMIRVSQTASSEGRGVAVIGNRFIGPPMIKSAERILRKAEIIAARETCSR